MRWSLRIAKKKLKELKAMLEEASYEYKDRMNRLQDLLRDIDLKKKQLNEVEASLSECRSEHYQAENLMNRLENRREVLQNLAKQPFNHQQGVKAVLDNQSALLGVLGVISQILKPQMNYEDAISNALGGAMYHIVTEDESAARHAITF